MGINGCPVCLEKQRCIDELKEKIQSLEAKLRYQERKAQEGYFGSSTPSSKIPIKRNSEQKEKKPKGARQGHKGSGRKSHECEFDYAVEVEAPDICPECGGILEKKGVEERSVLDTPSQKPERIVFRLPKRYCYRCERTFTPQTPGVLPKSLYGNQLIANAMTMYYFYGLPMGRICEQTGVSEGSLMEVYHRMGRLFERVPQKLIEEYRQAPVKHADETSWRTDGKNGYVWLFATPDLSIFQFGKSRSSQVAHAVLGKDRLPGVLVVDRYRGYKKAPCEIQYCYAHLLRDVQDLEKEFPEEAEVSTFVAVVAPLLALAQGLRSQPITDKQFYRRAAKLRTEIKAAMERPARHMGIRRIQGIFRENEERLYHWARDRTIPAENNLAERDLRPTVVARKVSYGSISDNGAKTRSILTTVLTTLKKRGNDPAEQMKKTLDQLATNLKLDPYELLFQRNGPQE
ncbi:IS66 family transposase [Desulfomonile tiedjei]|uniref:Transposase IS66 family n=1 Tax=Desulfomonile tiedjei (strain ATCC 49306 / DSM 6799 / DCB-1) TaxID=706587 RepID=I4C990_DESTA|nr:IS66 family transposase [Desulfomonile tiedjei]AFM24613.1 Transposase IS66 family [Desulfomonile tiedjei DSM 6799]AFM24649.1 Transposase IS66 family [Desulfomonile tiedjei DSM 6799]AFM25894.1 Transposase IS66 family [Desulfomonile tiedjei DSM 6799]AFM26131.1 Transposase IS66 family [Desulfomonile tiedjei DSM 6799]